MKISSYQHGRGTVVTPREPILDGDCNDVRRSVVEALASGSSHIVLDMGEVPYVDSAGLELLCELQSTCSNGGAHFKVAALNETCEEILRITDLREQFQTFGSVEDAAKSLS